MSRIGQQPVSIPEGVDARIEGQTVIAKGPKGELSLELSKQIQAKVTDDGIKVEPIDLSQQSRSFWGLSRSLVSNIVEGVSKGFEKRLEISGVGYRAQVQGQNLLLALGLSHEVKYEIPNGIEIKCPKPTEIVVSGIDKQRVGQISAEIRKFRPPEPYKGKGIRYEGEAIVRKEGKKK